MGDEVKKLVQGLRSGQVNVLHFCGQFRKLVDRRVLLTEGNLLAQLSNLRQAIEIFSSVRRSLPNNDIVTEIGKDLFLKCAKVILSHMFQNAGRHVEVMQFRHTLRRAEMALKDYGYSHRFEMLRWLIKNHWQQPLLRKLILGEKVNVKDALEYVNSGEFPELLKIRVEMLLDDGAEDWALNLTIWCLANDKMFFDPFLRAVQLMIFHSRGMLRQFYEQCRNMPSCVGVEILKTIDSDAQMTPAYLTMAQTFLLQDWLKPSKYCCTKELLELWLEAEYNADQTEEQFLDALRNVVEYHQNTLQLMSLITVMHDMFGKEFLQFYLEVCLLALHTEKLQLSQSAMKRDMREIRGAKSSLTFICTTLGSVCSNWNLKLRRRALLTALSLEPRKDVFHTIYKLYTVYRKPKNPAKQYLTLMSAGTKGGPLTEAMKHLFETGGLPANQQDSEQNGSASPAPPVGEVVPDTVFAITRLLDHLRSRELDPKQPWSRLKYSCITFMQRHGVNVQLKSHSINDDDFDYMEEDDSSLFQQTNKFTPLPMPIPPTNEQKPAVPPGEFTAVPPGEFTSVPPVVFGSHIKPVSTPASHGENSQAHSMAASEKAVQALRCLGVPTPPTTQASTHITALKQPAVSKSQGLSVGITPVADSSHQHRSSISHVSSVLTSGGIRPEPTTKTVVKTRYESVITCEGTAYTQTVNSLHTMSSAVIQDKPSHPAPPSRPVEFSKSKSSDVEKVQALSKEFFQERMRDLLKPPQERSPQAKIVLSGTLPSAVAKSDIASVAQRLVSGDKPLLTFKDLVGRKVPQHSLPNWKTTTSQTSSQVASQSHVAETQTDQVPVVAASQRTMSVPVALQPTALQIPVTMQAKPLTQQATLPVSQTLPFNPTFQLPVTQINSVNPVQISQGAVHIQAAEKSHETRTVSSHPPAQSVNNALQIPPVHNVTSELKVVSATSEPKMSVSQTVDVLTNEEHAKNIKVVKIVRKITSPTKTMTLPGGSIKTTEMKLRDAILNTNTLSTSTALNRQAALLSPTKQSQISPPKQRQLLPKFKGSQNMVSLVQNGDAVSQILAAQNQANLSAAAATAQMVAVNTQMLASSNAQLGTSHAQMVTANAQGMMTSPTQIVSAQPQIVDPVQYGSQPPIIGQPQVLTANTQLLAAASPQLVQAGPQLIQGTPMLQGSPQVLQAAPTQFVQQAVTQLGQGTDIILSSPPPPSRFTMQLPGVHSQNLTPLVIQQAPTDANTNAGLFLFVPHMQTVMAAVPDPTLAVSQTLPVIQHLTSQAQSCSPIRMVTAAPPMIQPELSLTQVKSSIASFTQMTSAQSLMGLQQSALLATPKQAASSMELKPSTQLVNSSQLGHDSQQAAVLQLTNPPQSAEVLQQAAVYQQGATSQQAAVSQLTNISQFGGAEVQQLLSQSEQPVTQLVGQLDSTGSAHLLNEVQLSNEEAIKQQLSKVNMEKQLADMNCGLSSQNAAVTAEQQQTGMVQLAGIDQIRLTPTQQAEMQLAGIDQIRLTPTQQAEMQLAGIDQIRLTPTQQAEMQLASIDQIRLTPTQQAEMQLAGIDQIRLTPTQQAEMQLAVQHINAQQHQLAQPQISISPAELPAASQLVMSQLASLGTTTHAQTPVGSSLSIINAGTSGKIEMQVISALPEPESDTPEQSCRSQPSSSEVSKMNVEGDSRCLDSQMPVETSLTNLNVQESGQASGDIRLERIPEAQLNVMMTDASQPGELNPAVSPAVTQAGGAQRESEPSQSHLNSVDLPSSEPSEGATGAAAKHTLLHAQFSGQALQDMLQRSQLVGGGGQSVACECRQEIATCQCGSPTKAPTMDSLFSNMAPVIQESLLSGDEASQLAAHNADLMQAFGGVLDFASGLDSQSEAEDIVETLEDLHTDETTGQPPESSLEENVAAEEQTSPEPSQGTEPSQESPQVESQGGQERTADQEPQVTSSQEEGKNPNHQEVISSKMPGHQDAGAVEVPHVKDEEGCLCQTFSETTDADVANVKAEPVLESENQIEAEVSEKNNNAQVIITDECVPIARPVDESTDNMSTTKDKNYCKLQIKTEKCTCEHDAKGSDVNLLEPEIVINEPVANEPVKSVPVVDSVSQTSGGGEVSADPDTRGEVSDIKAKCGKDVNTENGEEGQRKEKVHDEDQKEKEVTKHEAEQKDKKYGEWSSRGGMGEWSKELDSNHTLAEKKYLTQLPSSTRRKQEQILLTKSKADVMPVKVLSVKKGDKKQAIVTSVLTKDGTTPKTKPKSPSAQISSHSKLLKPIQKVLTSSLLVPGTRKYSPPQQNVPPRFSMASSIHRTKESTHNLTASGGNKSAAGSSTVSSVPVNSQAKGTRPHMAGRRSPALSFRSKSPAGCGDETPHNEENQKLVIAECLSFLEANSGTDFSLLQEKLASILHEKFGQQNGSHKPGERPCKPEFTVATDLNSMTISIGGPGKMPVKIQLMQSMPSNQNLATNTTIVQVENGHKSAKDVNRAFRKTHTTACHHGMFNVKTQKTQTASATITSKISPRGKSSVSPSTFYKVDHKFPSVPHESQVLEIKRNVKGVNESESSSQQEKGQAHSVDNKDSKISQNMPGVKQKAEEKEVEERETRSGKKRHWSSESGGKEKKRDRSESVESNSSVSTRSSRMTRNGPDPELRSSATRGRSYLKKIGETKSRESERGKPHDEPKRVTRSGINQEEDSRSRSPVQHEGKRHKEDAPETRNRPSTEIVDGLKQPPSFMEYYMKKTTTTDSTVQGKQAKSDKENASFCRTLRQRSVRTSYTEAEVEDLIMESEDEETSPLPRQKRHHSKDTTASPDTRASKTAKSRRMSESRKESTIEEKPEGKSKDELNQPQGSFGFGYQANFESFVRKDSTDGKETLLVEGGKKKNEIADVTPVEIDLTKMNRENSQLQSTKVYHMKSLPVPPSRDQVDIQTNSSPRRNPALSNDVKDANILSPPQHSKSIGASSGSDVEEVDASKSYMRAYTDWFRGKTYQTKNGKNVQESVSPKAKMSPAEAAFMKVMKEDQGGNSDSKTVAVSDSDSQDSEDNQSVNDKVEDENRRVKNVKMVQKSYAKRKDSSTNNVTGMIKPNASKTRHTRSRSNSTDTVISVNSSDSETKQVESQHMTVSRETRSSSDKDRPKKAPKSQIQKTTPAKGECSERQVLATGSPRTRSSISREITAISPSKRKTQPEKDLRSSKRRSLDVPATDRISRSSGIGPADRTRSGRGRSLSERNRHISTAKPTAFQSEYLKSINRS